MEVSARSLARFLRSLAVLAMDAQGQIAWLRSLGLGEPGIADELALEFDDGCRLMWAFVSEGWLPDESRAPIEALDRALARMSGPTNAEVWDVRALATSPQWAQVRELAREALHAIA